MLKAVITGVAGQDGSYLAELLLSKGYQVLGITRSKSVEPGLKNISGFINHHNFRLIWGDVTDSVFLSRILHLERPHEWFNAAAMSHVGQSFKDPLATFDVDARSVLLQLGLIKELSPSTRFVQFSTSELFGGLSCPTEGYTENSPFHPRSPYGVAKLAAFWSVKNYREAYNLYACNAIMHNHSSPRRGPEFATRKITRGVAKIKLGLAKTLKMGYLDAFRDEGYSADYMRAVHLILQQEHPDDYLIATGEGATIREMLEYVCQLADLDFNQVYEQDPQFMRPSEVPYLKGNPQKAITKLGWKPEYSWKKLLKAMYFNDLAELSV